MGKHNTNLRATFTVALLLFAATAATATALRDISIAAVRMTSATVNYGDSIRFSVTYYNAGVLPADSVGIDVQVGNLAPAHAKMVQRLGTHKTATATLSIAPPDGLQPTIGLELSISVTDFNGRPDENADNNTGTTTFDYLTETFNRNVVIEEGTGTWCGWCVRGIVAMKEMKEKYPDFIGIAVHSGDAVTQPSYVNYCGFSGYPSCNVDRTITNTDVSTNAFEEYYAQEKAASCPAGITATAAWDETHSKIYIKTTSRFGAGSTNAWGVAIAVVEDSLAGYTQSNYYAGGGYGTMGGFENLGSYAKVTLNDVARGIYPNYYGQTIANGVEAATDYDFNYTIANPTMRNYKKVSIVALLLNKTTGAIVNAVKVQPLEAAEATDISAAPSATTQPLHTDHYALDGRHVAPTAKGVVLQRTTYADGSTRTRKILNPER